MVGGLTVVRASTGIVDAGTDPRSPARVLDTRTGIGATAGRLEAGTVLRLTIPGITIVGETAALLNLTTTEASIAGHVSIWPCGSAVPKTSIVNFEPGRSIPNMVAVGYTAQGVCFSSSSAVHLVADLTAVTTNGDLHGIAPQRLIDTREGVRYQAGNEYRVMVGGTPGIPGDAAGAALNVTIVNPSAAGFVVVKPCGSTTNASTVNFLGGDVVAHFTFTALAAGAVCLTSTTSTDVVVDSFGWIAAGSAVRSIAPDRLLDTRSGLGGTYGEVGNDQVVRLRVAGIGNVPNTAAGATINIVAVNNSADGYVTVFPCDSARPLASTLNLWSGALRSNQATIRLSSSGELCIAGRILDPTGTHLVVDVVGFVAGNVVRTPPPVTMPPTIPPSGSRFSTLPPGSALPTGAECAQRVRPAAEIRPENSTRNHTRGTGPNSRNDWSGFQRVDGNFTGTTDEILQWAACKWGIDEDIVRAQIVKESNWYQSAIGDNGESFGLGQVRITAHGTAFPNAVNSSAYNVDYTYASWRACYEGVYTWLNQPQNSTGVTYVAGDVWGCVGLWFSGRWYDQGALNYINDGDTNGYGSRGVRTHYQLRTWEDPAFING
jgi:autotransporter family porin